MSPIRAVLVDRSTSAGRTCSSRTDELGSFSVEGTALVAPDWRHECGARPRAVHVSADRVLVLTDSLDYHAWGILGPALLLDLHTGERVASLRGDRAAALDGGRFLLGLEGYGVFDTRLHDRNGRLVTTWPSYGHYVVDAGGVRVVECDRGRPAGSAVVRLLPDGSVERGHPLRDRQVGVPVVLADGTIVAFDGGALIAVGPDLRGEVLAELLDVGPDSWRFSANLEMRDDSLVVTVVERSDEAPVEHRTHRVVCTLHP